MEDDLSNCNFQPRDEHNKWIKWLSWAIWFKNSNILAVHNCYMKVNPKAIEGDGLPGIGGEDSGPIIEQPQSPPNNEQPILTTIDASSSLIEEQTEIEEEEPEAPS